MWGSSTFRGALVAALRPPVAALGVVLVLANLLLPAAAAAGADGAGMTCWGVLAPAGKEEKPPTHVTASCCMAALMALVPVPAAATARRLHPLRMGAARVGHRSAHPAGRARPPIRAPPPDLIVS